MRLVFLFAALNCLLLGATAQTYWWYFPLADCPYDDVAGSCANQTVAQCEALCLATPGCGGFNYPHGYLKQTSCLSKMVSDGTVGLYILKNTPYNFPPVWPAPQEYTYGSANVTVDSINFQFTYTGGAPFPDLAGGFARYQPLFFPHRAPSGTTGALPCVKVSVVNTTAPLQLYVDESYTLTIPLSGCILLEAETVFGVYHGLETLSQLITFDFNNQVYYIPYAPWTIYDYPRFPHREVLVDSSRHFEPVQTLKNLLDSLVYAKINTVHWHLVDTQSFPFDSPSAPLLGQMGSYSPQERFSVNDVADVIEYARQRGIRMMVEIDTPGHAGSWCNGYPEICPAPNCTQPLNVANNYTFEIIENLFMDLTGGVRGSGLFFDNLMHLGGDEVDTTCWSDSPEISQWLASRGLSPDGGYEYFVNRTQAIARGFGRDCVGWEEIWDHFGTELDPSTIIHQWLDGSTIAINATAHGYRVLWSTDGVWYLDGLTTTWQTMYVQEPCTGIPDNLCDTLVLGGGGEMWGETVDTSDIQQTIWPRLGAIAERLWSNRNLTDTDAATPRYSAFRCLLNRRGVAAAPADNAQAREAPPQPGGCYTQ